VQNFLKELEQRVIKNFFDIIILIELKKTKSLSGYDFVELVHRRFGMLLSPGMVYSRLYSMEREGLIKGDCVEEKRVYNLTDSGAEMINSLLQTRVRILDLIQTVFEEQD
jgi:DNA-binding PadR family transcriptional regulator